MQSLDPTDIAELIAGARASPRRRLNRNLHGALDEPVNRLAIAIEPDSYIRPHRHDRTETVVILAGAIDVLAFHDDGRLLERRRLDTRDGARVLEYPPGTWHALFACESPSVFFEVKQGPYVPLAPQDSAPWAPAEGNPSVAAWLRYYRDARPGERFTPSP